MSELENGVPKHHSDFRRVYATVLESWLGFDSRAALGDEFELLDVFEALAGSDKSGESSP